MTRHVLEVDKTVQGSLLHPVIETPSRPAIDDLPMSAQMDDEHVGDVMECHHADVFVVAVLARPDIETVHDLGVSSAGALLEQSSRNEVVSNCMMALDFALTVIASP